VQTLVISSSFYWFHARAPEWGWLLQTTCALSAWSATSTWKNQERKCFALSIRDVRFT